VAAKRRSHSGAPGSVELSVDVAPARRERTMRRLAAVVAPVAADAGAVVDDPGLLELARAVCAAFGAGETGGGLTRAQIVERVGRDFAAAVVESRLHVFERLGLLRPYLDKKHQQRYTLNPAGLVGQHVFDRIGERGGVDELLTLLDRTRSLLAGRPDRDELRAHLRHLTELLTVYADDLERLNATAPLAELLAERDDHDRATALQSLPTVADQVTERFPDLRAPATKLVEEASRYLLAVESLMTRVLDMSGATRDFSVLPADDYLSAAITGSVAELAAAFAPVVFDPPTVWVGAADLVDAIDRVGPRRPRARRPPAPRPAVDADPVGSLLAGAERTARARGLRAEQLLDGHADTEVTSTVRGLMWPAAAAMLADLLALDLDPDQPYGLTISEATIVDTETDVTYASPVTLRADRPVLDDSIDSIEVVLAEAVTSDA
jgi:hypothetical protein